MGCDIALLGGVAGDTPATHWKQQSEPRQGCSYTLERDRGGGGVASAPLRADTDTERYGFQIISATNLDKQCVHCWAAVLVSGQATTSATRSLPEHTIP